MNVKKKSIFLIIFSINFPQKKKDRKTTMQEKFFVFLENILRQLKDTHMSKESRHTGILLRKEKINNIKFIEWENEENKAI